MRAPLFRLFRPILFQGIRNKGRYFEGWYFKQTTQIDRKGRAFAFIPGISRSGSGSHAFVQTMDGLSGASRYFTFPAEDFSYRDDPFEVRVGKNLFSCSNLSADLADEAGGIRAELEYADPNPPATSLLSPGVMGPYGFAPFLECYHGIASLDHSVTGSIEMSPKAEGSSRDKLVFAQGRGYIEKDWGRSMPSSWVWIQSNDFDPKVGPASFSCSLARVPWLGGSFNGLICILWTSGIEYRFATYTGARVDLLERNGASLHLLISDRSYKMEIQLRGTLADRRAAALPGDESRTLAAPVDGAMDRRIIESMDARLRIVLKRRRGSTEDIIFDASSGLAAVELTGDTSSLIP